MIVNCFWHGTQLSLLEQLTLKSFTNNGYQVHLWRYDTSIDISCPSDVTLQDANLILPLDRLFLYKGNGDCRRGSIGGFSDLFRYYLIYKIGGIYVDMDTVCLHPYNFESEYVIRPHKNCDTVANIFKAPAGCNFLRECIERTEEAITAENESWVLPVRIFNDTVQKFNLQNYIVPREYFGDDDINDIRKAKHGLFLRDRNVLPKYILHWCREASYGIWDYREVFNWNNPKPLSIYYNLLLNNGLIKN